ncbi:S8 family serine peptidase [Marinobacter shengliensis]|uniref:S8 family serine peptidase n=1 Tax=Marinobacter shengliensis TaxID=1389223 RepID=UPI001D187D10|nr:S8 family serine peptidase [Marinobacter shengliensis]
MKKTLPQYLVLSGVVLFAGCGGGSGSSESQPPAIDLGPLSGVISIESGSRIDQDTMDQLRFAGASPASGAQTLPASFVLAGFVSSRNGSYPLLNGQLFSYSDDPVDTYTVPMGPGETVILRNFGGRDGNAELELRVTGGGILYGEEETAAGKPSVSVTLDGGAPERDYSVEVNVANGGGPARYVLVKAADSQLESLSLDWPSHQFLFGQAIVTLDATDTGTMSSLATGMANGERHLGGEDWLMRMPVQASSHAVSATQMQAETLSWISQLRQMPGVEDAIPNYQMSSMQSSPVDEPLYGLQWHYDLINGPGAWQLAPDGGEGASVAVLDSGLFSPNGTTAWHPDLAANVDAGRDFVDNDFYPEDPGSSVGASVFHGTHVAGTVAAEVNGEGIGGVAFGSRIVPVRVLGEGGTGSSTALIDAIRWVTGQSPALSSPRADVVNLSLGGLPRIQALEDAIAFGVGRGMIFVGAAGNSATSTQSFPAASPNVLAVSAVDAAGRLSSYSNFGSWIDLAAPGGDASRDGNNDGRADLIWSTSAVGQSGQFVASYTGLQGTSMATPHVSGVVALLKAQKDTLTYSEVRALLESGELTDYPGSRNDQLGYGVLDAAKALQANLEGSVTILSPSPSQVSLSNEGVTSATVTLNQIGDSSISNVVLTENLDWLSSNQPTLENGRYVFNVSLVESEIEPDTAYRGDVVVAYDSDQERSVRIPVIAQLISDEQARNAGTHFVLLVDTTPDDDGFYWAEAQVAVEASNGSYGFRFESWDGEEPRRLNEVSPGDYFLVAGTDIDGDGIICQPGEACAEYPISGLREVITIEEDQSLSDLRMTTSFTRPTISAETPDILPRPGFQGYRLITPERDSARTNSDNRPRMTQ